MVKTRERRTFIVAACPTAALPFSFLNTRPAWMAQLSEDQMTNRTTRTNRLLKLSALGLTLVAALSALQVANERAVMAAGRGDITTSPVYSMWDPDTVIGTSRLIRTESGITAVFKGSGVPRGHAMTLWFGVINNPEACATSPCTLADFGNPEVQGDFLWGGGIVTGGSGKDHFGGHLRVGDASGSAFIEFGIPEAAVGLLEPLTAEVFLLIHSHGPAVPGQVLKSQLTSFTGGCVTYLGPDGFAAGPQDVPDEVGECSTFQISHHE